MVALSAWHTPPSPPPCVPRRAAWHSFAYTPYIARRSLADGATAAASRQKPLHCPQLTAHCTGAVEEASIYCTNWPTFAKNQ